MPGSDGSNDFLYIIALTTRMWDTFCAAMDRPEMVVDPRFADEMARIEHADELRDEIRNFTMQHTKWEAMQILGEAGVPCSATHDTYDLFHNPHLRGARLHPGHRSPPSMAQSASSAGRPRCPGATSP